MLEFDFSVYISLGITLVIAFTVHEFAHAWTADQLGDDTPRLHGRLTLNPMAHLDLIGTIAIFLVGLGWAKPVPVNPYVLQRRNPAGFMLVAAAGPISNLLLALIAVVPFRAGVIDVAAASGGLLPSLADFLGIFIGLNLALLFFNLLPIFPLDGEKVLSYFLPPSGQATMDRLRPYGPMILLALIVFGRFGGFDLLGILVFAPARFLGNLLIS